MIKNHKIMASKLFQLETFWGAPNTPAINLALENWKEKEYSMKTEKKKSTPLTLKGWAEGSNVKQIANCRQQLNQKNVFLRETFVLRQQPNKITLLFQVY